jgi:hypothetical protein
LFAESADFIHTMIGARLAHYEITGIFERLNYGAA